MVKNFGLNVSVNIMIGFITGYLLYITFFDPQVVRGPNSKDIVGKTFTHMGERYELIPKIYPAPVRLFD